MSFRAWLRELLDQGRYRSQYQMAKEFGVRPTAVTHWMKGERRPDLGSCRRISKATGTPLADIAEMVQEDMTSLAMN